MLFSGLAVVQFRLLASSLFQAANCYSATITRRCAIAKFRRAFERLAYRTVSGEYN